VPSLDGDDLYRCSEGRLRQVRGLTVVRGDAGILERPRRSAEFCGLLVVAPKWNVGFCRAFAPSAFFRNAT
jgi:hypothetical protein